MIKLYKTICFIMIGLLLCGCTSKPDTVSEPASESSQNQTVSVSRDIFAMDTYMTITCYGENARQAADAAEAEIKRLDDLLSTGDPDSEVSLLNLTGSAHIGEDIQTLTAKALKLYENTAGAFDITIYPIMQLWGFTTHEYSVPDKESLSLALSNVDSDRITLSGDVLTLSPGQAIDFGAIAKGYTSDRVSELFAEYDLTAGLISLGGNVQLYKAKPDGSPWRIGIRDPHPDATPQDVLGILEAEDCAVITSGSYERFFEGPDGQIYHHIIDPSTGYPAASGIISSTIVSASGMLADGLSTAVYVMGLENATELWRTSDESFEMILMTNDDEIYITEGLSGSFSGNYDVNIISR